MLEKFSMNNIKPVSTPLANHFRLSIVQCSKIDDDEKDMSKISYASVVRYLMYVMVCIRPDLAHSVSIESKFLSNPGRHNWASGSSNA
jgi:ATP-binding cassette subfamily B (MDR/TAP) protein 1